VLIMMHMNCRYTRTRRNQESLCLCPRLWLDLLGTREGLDCLEYAIGLRVSVPRRYEPTEAIAGFRNALVELATHRESEQPMSLNAFICNEAIDTFDNFFSKDTRVGKDTLHFPVTVVWQKKALPKLVAVMTLSDTNTSHKVVPTVHTIAYWYPCNAVRIAAYNSQHRATDS